MSDHSNGTRQVHAESHNGVQIVHYIDRRKWWKESRPGSKYPLKPTPLTYDEAVRLAGLFYRAGGRVALGLPGGRYFDTAMKKERRSEH